MTLQSRLRQLVDSGNLDLPLPGGGRTPLRHRRLADLARLDLSLARLAEAHVDAVAILAEAGRRPKPGIYGVWAAETSGLSMSLECGPHGMTISGSKLFCSGAGIIDRALLTVEHRLVDVSLRELPGSIEFDQTAWKAAAFASTQTAQAHFLKTPLAGDAVVGEANWYIERPGFWHGACGPAACWAGGAMGLFDYALAQSRNDAHTLAHLGAMHADVWALGTYMDCAGNEIDGNPTDRHAAVVRALTVRHLIEQASSDILRRLGRAYGPRPLAFDAKTSERYHEVELYIRQSHAERDLESLGKHLYDHAR